MSAMRLLACALLAVLALASGDEAAAQRPFRIYAITFRGMTDVERGFQEYFAARRIPVQITFRDLNRDNGRMQGFLDGQTGEKCFVIWLAPTTACCSFSRSAWTNATAEATMMVPTIA